MTTESSIMSRSWKLVSVVAFFAMMEFLTIFYYEHDKLYFFDKIANTSQPVTYQAVHLERIHKEIHDEEEAIYATHPYPETTTTCEKYKGVRGARIHHRRTDQFLINQKHGLIWCNIFKAASSSWLWNFNVLAGYSERQLLAKINEPLNLARKKYMRPSPSLVDVTRRRTPHPITFIIVRHPFSRLVSGFRDKILKGTNYYRPLAKNMMLKHRELMDQHPDDWGDHLKVRSLPMPTFAQFIQYILDEKKNRRPLNEHWVPMNEYCTPCSNRFDIIAKVETLSEDGNYIIYKSGVQDTIKPKVLNKAEGKSSDKLTEYFICQLTESQLESIIEVYKYDFEMFDYSVQAYRDCVSKNSSVESSATTRTPFFKPR